MEKIRLIDDASVRKIVHLVVHAWNCNSHKTQIGDRNTYELGARNLLIHSTGARIVETGEVRSIFVLSTALYGACRTRYRDGYVRGVSECCFLAVGVWKSEAEFK